RSARLLEVLGRIGVHRAFAHEVRVEAAQRREPARDGRRLAAGTALPLHPREHIIGPRGLEAAATRTEQAQEVADVAAIGVESVTGRAALGAEGGKEVVERALGLHGPMLTDGRREAEAPRRRSTRGLPPRAAGIGRVASVTAGSVVRTLHTALGVEPATSARSPDRSP